MTPEDRIAEALRRDAASYSPSGAVGDIDARVRVLRRRRTMRWGGLGALAVIVAAAVAVPVMRRQGHHPTERVAVRPPATTAPTTAAPGAQPTPTRAPSPPATAPPGPPGGPVPKGFVAASATFVSPSEGWVLGSAPCPAQPCTSIVRTRDGGRTWQGIPAPPVKLMPTGNDAVGASLLRFADPRNGFAFRDGLWTTHDGGATWHKVDAMPGMERYVVMNLVATAGSVYAVVFDPHGAGARLVRADARTDDFKVVDEVGKDTGFTALVATDGVVYATTSESASRPGELVRVVGTTVTSTSLPDAACFNLTESTTTSLLLVCHPGLGVDATVHSRRAYGSVDSGATWHRLPDPDTAATRQTQTYAVADAGKGHAFIATGEGDGSYILGTFDGGKHWVKVLDRGDDGRAGFLDLGFEDVNTGIVVHGLVYAASTQGPEPAALPPAGELYRTSDGGRTWSPVKFS